MKISSVAHLISIFFISIFAAIMLSWPYLQPKFFHLHDFTHVARLVELEQGIKDKQLPVRWSTNLGYGYGMPQFSFYGPLFYYEAYIFRLFGISYIWSIKYTVILQVVVSFIALYFLGKNFWGKTGGLITAFAGTFATYRAVDMYVRGAFGELSAMTFIPLSLLALYQFIKSPSLIRLVFASASIAGIALSHTLITLIAAPFIVAYTLFLHVYFRKLSIKHLTLSLAAGLLALGLSAYFVMPALLEKQYTKADLLTTGFSNYNFHFLYIRQFWNSDWGYGGSIWGPEDDVSFELGKVHIILAGIVFLSTTYSIFRRKNPKHNLLVIFFFFLLGISLFLTLLKSKPLYDALPFMAYLQFPWRYLSISIIFMAIICGAITAILPKKIRIISAAAIITLIVTSQNQNFTPQGYLEDEDLLYYSDAQSIQHKMSGIIPDFLPAAASPSALPAGVTPEKRFLVDGIKPIIEVNHSHEFLLELGGHPETKFTANIFDFPGWQLYLDGQPIPHQRTDDGRIQLYLPAATETSYLSGKFEETPLRLTADIITLASLLISLYIGSNRSKPHHE